MSILTRNAIKGGRCMTALHERAVISTATMALIPPIPVLCLVTLVVTGTRIRVLSRGSAKAQFPFRRLSPDGWRGEARQVTLGRQPCDLGRIRVLIVS